MGFGRSIKKTWSKAMGRGPLSVVGMGKGGAVSMQPGSDSMWNKAWHEVGAGVDHITGAAAMQDLLDAQNAANQAALANAERQSAIAAGKVQQVQEAGTEQALSKLMKKSALKMAIRTAGQPREGRQTLG